MGQRSSSISMRVGGAAAARCDVCRLGDFPLKSRPDQRTLNAIQVEARAGGQWRQRGHAA